MKITAKGLLNLFNNQTIIDAFGNNDTDIINNIKGHLEDRGNQDISDLSSLKGYRNVRGEYCEFKDLRDLEHFIRDERGEDHRQKLSNWLSSLDNDLCTPMKDKRRDKRIRIGSIISLVVSVFLMVAGFILACLNPEWDKDTIYFISESIKDIFGCLLEVVGGVGVVVSSSKVGYKRDRTFLIAGILSASIGFLGAFLTSTFAVYAVFGRSNWWTYFLFELIFIAVAIAGILFMWRKKD